MTGDGQSRAEDAEPQKDLAALMERSRDRLRRMVQLRLDHRLTGRIDPSDVIQEAYLDATSRYDEYRRDPRLPPFLWLRLLTGQKLLQLHRHHLGVAKRDASLEVALDSQGLPAASSANLADELLSGDSSPSKKAMRAELRAQLQQALDDMDSVDREILTLRHFEQLTNSEAAQVLGLTAKGASSRYVRALRRLKETFVEKSGRGGAWNLDAVDS